MDESLALARHIAATHFHDIPMPVVETTKRSILDALGVTLAASTLGEGCQSFIDLAVAEASGGACTIVGTGHKVSPTMAAFANGAMAHALDFEDAHDAALVHPNAPTIPAALAIAESLGNVSGRDFITAVALGSDLVCRMGLALKRDLLADGWYMPPILGAFGATAAACKLLGLNERQILDAFSLALCQATCSAEQIHSRRTIIRSIRDAFPAKAGLISALLAQRSVIGFEQPFEGRGGLYQSYARGEYDRDKLTADLGKTFEGGRVSFKAWPSCRAAHPYVGAALELVANHQVNPQEIQSIHIIVSPTNRMVCEPAPVKLNPATAIDAKFSLYFCVATACIHRQVTLDQFTPDALTDSAVLALAHRVTYSFDPTLERGSTVQGTVAIHLADRSLTQAVGVPYGHPANPMSDMALISKFKDCARHARRALRPADADRIVQLVLAMDKIENVCELASYL